MPELTIQDQFDLSRLVSRGRDIFLCHTGVDKPWVEGLAERIETVRYKDSYLGVVLDKWDFGKGKNIVLELEQGLDTCRFIGLVVTRAMLKAEWPTLERSIAVWSDPSGSKGRVLVLLLENVELPATLRMRNWIDFRDPAKFEEAFLELISVLRDEPLRRGRGGLLPTLPASLPYTPAPVVITSSSGADKVDERLVSNLLPVTKLPQVVQSADTELRKKSDISKYTEERDIPPFILREGKLFTFSDLHEISNPLDGVVDAKTLRDEVFRDWFSDDRKPWAIELLNISFRQHCWKRFMRFESTGQRYFFSPRNGKPKQISWYINGKRTREVTTPHYATRLGEDGQPFKYQHGWRHQAIRAAFMHLPVGLFLKIVPTYLLTKDDGKTPRGGTRVGPILSQWLNQERNGQILRSLRFWSLVLSRGNKNEIVIPTGHEQIVIELIPATGLIDVGILGDSIDYDRLIEAEFEDDLKVPELEPEQYSLFTQGEL